MASYYESSSAYPDGDLLVAKGYIDANPNYVSGTNYYRYVEIYYSRKYSSGYRVYTNNNTGPFDADKSMYLLDINTDLDRYYQTDGRLVAVGSPHRGGSIYPQKSVGDYPLSIRSAEQPRDGAQAYIPGALHVVVRGIYAPDNSEILCSSEWAASVGSYAGNPPGPLTYKRYPLTDLGNGTYSFELTRLAKAGYYNLNVATTASTPKTASGTAMLNVEYAQPSTCQLRVEDSDSVAPTRIGANDGQVFGRLTHLGTGAIVVSLWQDGQHLPGLDTQVGAPTNGQTTLDYRILGVPPGEYSVHAQQVSCSFPRADTPDGELQRVVVDPPDLNIGDQLTFLPWVQSRLAHAATAAGSDGRPTLDLGAELRKKDGNSAFSSENLPAFKGEIYGPGDVLGLNERAILTTMPHPNATGFSPLQLPAIDFKEEDLPWRFSLPAASGQPPLPWCFLLVLKDDDATREFTALPLTGPLPSIRVPAGWPAPSADPGQAQYWAHVQLNVRLGDATANPPLPPTPTEIDDFLTKILPTNPDLAYSRVLSPRRLEPNTRYQAFLLPAIEAGRRAGLGMEFNNSHLVSALPTGGGTAPEQVFPVYYQWRFATGTADDFEDLVQQLHPFRGAADAAVPTLAVTTGLTTRQLPLPTLLSAADALPTLADVPLPVASYLYGRLAPGFTGQRPASGRPLVAPPLYGRAYLVTPTLLDPAVPTRDTPDGGVAPSWKHQLNLDPRYRALAALGAQVVQENQEDYVSRAWEQVRDILLANEKLRAAQYALRTTSGLRDQHLPLNITTTTTTTSATGGGRLASFARSAEAETDASFAPTAETDAALAPRADADAPAPVSEVATQKTTISPILATLDGAGASPAAPVLADYGLHLTALSLSRVRVSDDAVARATTPKGQPVPRLTAREAIRRSSTPAAAFSPAFRRLSKPFGKYQVGQAGRPLRPTQPEPEAPADDAATLQLPGTSLRQRDGLLRHLASGALTAAPERAERVRAYQFFDETVDNYLKDTANLPLGPVFAAAYPAAAERFGQAFGAFRDLGLAADGTQKVVGFRKVQYQRPALDLDILKADVVAGTDPAPVFQVKIKTAGPALPLPATYPPGDYRGRDFNASHFYVGDFEEPVAGDWLAADFLAADFLVPVAGGSDGSDLPTDELPTLRPAPVVEAALAEAPAEASALARTAAFASFNTLTTTITTTTTTAAARQTDATLPIIRQAKVFPVFKDAMGEQLRLRRPELFVPGLRDFPLGGVARLGASQAFVEAYLVGLNHALGSELSWRGFPVELRGTFFQQFWDVSEHLNHAVPLPTATAPAPQATAADETALLDIKPIAEWVSAPLGENAPAGSLAAAAPAARPLRLALRSELLRRYPTLAFALQKPDAQDATRPDPDLGQLVPPRQRLAVGPDMAVLSFGNITRQQALAGNYFLLLMQRPGQPQFGLDAALPQNTKKTDDPLSWNDLSWPYLENLGFGPGKSLTFDPLGKPFAPSEALDQTHLTDSARVAYALFQEPILAAIPLSAWLS